MKNIQTVARKHAGYTIDQTILIVAVIAILITLIIASVGWDLLQRTSGTKLASQLKQVEDANGQFLARHNVWPSDAIDLAVTPAAGSSETQAVAALIDSTQIAVQFQGEHQNMLPSVVMVAGVPQHQFGNGNTLSQVALDGGGFCGADDRLVVKMVGVPETELERANAAIDGDAEATPDTLGRLRWGVVANGVADLTYCANVLN